MQLLVKNLSDYQSLKYGTFKTQNLLFNPNDAIKEVVKTYSIDSKMINASIIYHSSEKDHLNEVMTDGERAIQVLENVIRHSVRLSKQRMNIEIDCWTDIEDLEG